MLVRLIISTYNLAYVKLSTQYKNIYINKMIFYYYILQHFSIVNIVLYFAYLCTKIAL